MTLLPSDSASATPALPSSAARDGSAITFASNYRIYLVTPAGRLELLGPGTDPLLSPDGTKILFNRFKHGDYKPWVMNANGSHARKLANQASDAAIRWSPDGTRIAFEGNHGVFVVNVDGSGLAKVADGGMPAWSPDGTKLAFVGQHGIYVVNADGTGQTLLTQGSLPAWSPDGSRIAYVGRSQDVYTIRPDGTHRMRVSTNVRYPGWPVWSPDGRKLAFDASGRRDNYDIWVVKANGTNQRDLTKTRHDTRDENTPTWSPNGNRIAFIAGRQVGQDIFNQQTFDVHVMNANGTHKRRLTEGLPPNYILSWEHLH